jgi:hypothetical protein
MLVQNVPLVIYSNTDGRDHRTQDSYQRSYKHFIKHCPELVQNRTQLLQ